MNTEVQRAPEINLLKSEVEAAAARVAERAMNTTVDGVAALVSDFIGGWFGDSLKQWRTRRLITALVKTKEHLEATGISIENAKSLPMGEVYAIFEGASKQEDPALTDMWAALLSNAINPSKDAFVDPSFVRILNDMSGLDALVINYIHESNGLISVYKKEVSPLTGMIYKINDKESAELKSVLSDIEKLKKRLIGDCNVIYKEISEGFNSENVSFSISNLLRLGLIFQPEQFGNPFGRELLRVGVSYRDTLTVDDSALRRILDDMKRRISMPIENSGSLYKLSEGDHGGQAVPAPVYALSGLGKRFILACR